MRIEHVNILGVGISAINMKMALDQITKWIESNKSHYICVTDVRCIIDAQENGKLRSILNNAFMCTPDGMPTVWIGKFKGFQHMDRVYGPDLMLEMMKVSVEKGFTNYFYGGKPGVAEKLKEKLTAKFPGTRIIGTYTPPFRQLNDQEEEQLNEEIHRLKPDIFWVGLSTPKQEHFMAAHLGKLNTKIMIGVGAAFDFHAGLVKQAPRWMQRSSLEWLYRVFQEPKRLWRRYLKSIPLFIIYFILEIIGLRKNYFNTKTKE